MHLQHSDTFVCNILQHAKTPERVKLQIQLEDTLQQLCNTLHQLELARFDYTKTMWYYFKLIHLI